jgi:hypothetical protein
MNAADLTKEGNDLVQNVHACFTNALEAARLGGDYDTEWEKAMQYQSELLRVINYLKINKPIDRSCTKG